MLDFDTNQTLRLMRKRGSRDEVLDTFNIEEVKEELVDYDSDFSSLNQSGKSLEFPFIKKWTSPRLRSVSSNRMNKSDDIDITNCNKSISPSSRIKHKLLNFYGDIEGVKIGDWWSSRLECSDVGVHRPAFANIHAGPDGAYSVALTVCQEYNDKGTSFVYSGSGCRDLRGSKDPKRRLSIPAQSKNPAIGGYNASLIRNFETGNPVRVIRGYKLNSKFAPYRGYRYDGLYTVEKFWTCKGASGLVVFKFLMIRCENQLPAPWELDYNHSKNHSMKQSQLISVKTATKDSVNQYQAMSSRNEMTGDDAIRENKSNGYADDNKENSTVNIADKLLSYDGFADASLLSADDSLPSINKRKLPRSRSKPKQNFKKHCERCVDGGDPKSAAAAAGREPDDPSESFRGFSPEFYPRKMILLGFLIHEMQSRLTANETV